MELSSPEIIAQLLASQQLSEHPRRQPRPQIVTADNGPTSLKRPTRRVGRCRCGHCKQCIDNARWERIFNEKFADPYYYSARPIRHSSSLDWLR
jgi:hypothetical protein